MMWRMDKKTPGIVQILRRNMLTCMRFLPNLCPMHVFAAEIEEIKDEDDLLEDLDALFSSMDIESVSPIHEEHIP